MRFEKLHCPQCGYALRGLPEPVCPECGFRFDPVILEYFRFNPPRDFLYQSIILSFVFPPLGLIALYFSLESRKAWRRSDFLVSEHLSRRAVSFGMFAVAGFFLTFAICCGGSLWP